MSRRNRHSIRSPKSFRKGAGMNAMRVDNVIDSLLFEKKDQIRQLLRDLYHSGAIKEFAKRDGSRRALNFEVVIDYQIITIRFIIWTDNTAPDSIDFSNSQRAQFVLRVNDNIEDLRYRFLRYIEGIKKGRLTEYLFGLSLEELERERVFHSFNKTGRTEDRDQKKDFVIRILKDGILRDLYLQVKSSEEALMAVKDELLQKGIAGAWHCFTGDLRQDIENIKAKITKIIEAYKQGQIIFV